MEEELMATILVVDDDATVRRSVELALKAAGHVVHQACGPQEAVDVAGRVTPDLMLVDVMMPEGTEGFHLVWEMRQLKDEALRNVPIIMVTGIHEHTEMRFYPDQTDGTYQAGEFLPVQGFMDKPVEPSLLLRKLGEVLGTK
jgi:CheY-like chemotaxis protein